MWLFLRKNLPYLSKKAFCCLRGVRTINRLDTALEVEKNSFQERYVTYPIIKFTDDGKRYSESQIIEEIEINVYVNNRYIHTLTCSPWNIKELVVGYLFYKNVIKCKQDLVAVHIDERLGIAEISLRSGSIKQGLDNLLVFSDTERMATHDIAKKRPNYLDARGLPFISSSLRITAQQLNDLTSTLENHSPLFKKTGGVHSALLINDKNVLASFEDIGRHSAVDKLAGWCLLNSVNARDKVLLFSGRVPYEIITKTIRLGCPIIISPGAPTQLSIELAAKHGVSIIGFAKNGQFNVYTHAGRVVF